MAYLESQHNDAQAAREEARRLRVKMKTFERYLPSFCWGCFEGRNAFAKLDSNKKKSVFCWCAFLFLAWMQSGRAAAGPESRGGLHDRRYGHRPGCSGAALHLLHLPQKVRASLRWHASLVPRPTPLPCWRVRVLLSLSREYDNLKGSLKSSNDICEKLKREVLKSNDKVNYMDVLLYPEESVNSRLVFFFLVAKSIAGRNKDQRGHEVSADRSDKCRERDQCKENLIELPAPENLWFMVNLPTEPQEESGVSSEDSQHTHTDQRSAQSTRLWKVWSYSTPDQRVCVCVLANCVWLSYLPLFLARPRWSWSSPTSTHPQETKTLTSTWPLTSPHQTRWQRNKQKSRPRRRDLAFWRKFTLEM